MSKLKRRRVVLAISGIVVAALLCCVVLAGLLWLGNRNRAILPWGKGDEVTVWPQPVCTPPACRDGEVYHCADVCPGGCGTTCATPTP